VLNLNQNLEKSIKNLDYSQIILSQMGNNNSSFLNADNSKIKCAKAAADNFQTHKNIYNNTTGYINYLKDKEEFNSILHLK